jgi:hypothetical protein
MCVHETPQTLKPSVISSIVIFLEQTQSDTVPMQNLDESHKWCTRLVHLSKTNKNSADLQIGFSITSLSKSDSPWVTS